MRVLSDQEVAKWFEQFEDLGVRSDYVHAGKDELVPFCTHPESACD